MERTDDIATSNQKTVEITVDGKKTLAIPGKSVLSVLFAIGKKAIGKNDHGSITGAYCGMGICYCCLVSIDGIVKQRACQVEVGKGMNVQTQRNIFDVLKPVKKVEIDEKSK